jgi:hypothetical protein
MEDSMKTISYLWVRSVLVVAVLTVAGSVFAEAPVVSSDAPRLEPRVMVLDEEWRVGGEDSDFVFGLLIDAVSDEAGNVYLLDNQLCQVEVFDSRGEHTGTLSRQGEGPGEVRVPMAIEWMPNGSLGLLELFPSKLVTIETDGTPRGNLTMLLGEENQTGFTASISAACRGDMLISAGQRATPTDGGQDRMLYLSRFDEAGKEQVRYCEFKTFLQFNPPLFDEMNLLPAFYFASAVGPDGRIYAAVDRVDYRIDVFLPDGTHDRRIERKFEPWKRTEQDRKRINAIVDAWFRRVPGSVERNLSDYELTITDIFVDDAGILWVQSSRSGRQQPDGILLTYDTFDAEGRFLQQVSVSCPGDASYDGLKFLGDGRVLLIKGLVMAKWAATDAQNVDFGDDVSDEPMEVVCYRIKS